METRQARPLPDLFQASIGSTLSSTSSRPREPVYQMPDTGRSSASGASKASRLLSSRSETMVRRPAQRAALEDDSEFQPSGVTTWGFRTPATTTAAWDRSAGTEDGPVTSKASRLPHLGRTLGAGAGSEHEFFASQLSSEASRETPWFADAGDDNRDSRSTNFSLLGTARSGARDSARRGLHAQTSARNSRSSGRMPAGSPVNVARGGQRFSPRTSSINEDWGWDWGSAPAATAQPAAVSPSAFTMRFP